MGNSAENPAGPLRNFFVFGEESRLENLKEKEAHIILFCHFLHDEVYLAKPLFHEFSDLAKIPFDSLDQNMSQKFIVVFKQSDGLSPNIFWVFLL